jgi:hypothetical protein
MERAKNLVYKFRGFCAKLFVNQQGGITKKGMDVPIMNSVMLKPLEKRKSEAGELALKMWIDFDKECAKLLPMLKKHL